MSSLSSSSSTDVTAKMSHYLTLEDYQSLRSFIKTNQDTIKDLGEEQIDHLVRSFNGNSSDKNRTIKVLVLSKILDENNLSTPFVRAMMFAHLQGSFFLFPIKMPIAFEFSSPLEILKKSSIEDLRRQYASSEKILYFVNQAVVNFRYSGTQQLVIKLLDLIPFETLVKEDGNKLMVIFNQCAKFHPKNLFRLCMQENNMELAMFLLEKIEWPLDSMQDVLLEAIHQNSVILVGLILSYNQALTNMPMMIPSSQNSNHDEAMPPLMHVCQGNGSQQERFKLVRTLLVHQANPNWVNSKGISPLVVSCQRKEALIVRKLMDAGAQVPSASSIRAPLFQSCEDYIQVLINTQKTYWKVEKWREFIDDCYQYLGAEVFDRGLHGYATEPGYLNGMNEACQLISDHLNVPTTADFYLSVHETACAHFNESATQTLIGKEMVGRFRGLDSINIECNLQSIAYIDKKVFSEVAEIPFNLCHFEFTKDHKAIVQYRKMSQDEVRHIFDAFLDEYHKELKRVDANNDLSAEERSDLKLRAIITFFYRCEWLHPVVDGTGRVDVAILQKHLTENGFHPTIIAPNPYIFTKFCFNDFVKHVKQGLKNWEKALTISSSSSTSSSSSSST